MVRNISATAHCDFSAQVDRLHRVPLTWLITGGVALMIPTTGRLAAKFKTKGVRSDSARRRKCRQVDTASFDKKCALCWRIYGDGVADIDITESIAFHRHESRLSLRTGLSLCKAEGGAAKTLIERTEERFGLKPERLAADTAYGAAPMLNWLVEKKGHRARYPCIRQVEAR